MNYQPKNNGGLKSAAKISVVPMITATYFMVAGGPYGLEDIVQKTGYAATLLILVITPLLWSLPTAMMVSELATAIPEEGGFYIWVRRGMGRFWGFQETWLTLAGSVFEMALYPNLCIAYIGQFAPGLVAGHRGLILGFAMIAICTAWNVLGVRSVGEGSVWLNVALLAPFVALTVLALGSGKFRRRRARLRFRCATPICSAACSSPCGITWAGTIFPRSRAKSRRRSARIRGRCLAR